MRPFTTRLYRTVGKRALDLCVATPAVIALLPLLTVVSLLIKLTSRGPVFFVQERLGKDGVLFGTLKFRTMTDRPREVSGEIHGKTDEVTAVGYWLRRFKIDELPQLWNVVRGDMSLVGPRPAVPASRPEESSLARRRLEVRPGLTGLAQVSGNIHLSWPERWVYDAEYVDRLSFRLDLSILAKTLVVIVFGEGRFLRRPSPPRAAN